MADGLFIARSNTLIGGRFEVDTAQSLADAGAGVPAFVARDRMAADGRRVALAVSRDASPRAKPLRILNEHIDNLMLPLGHGVAPLAAGKGVGYFVICTTPPGPPLSAELTQWSEKMATDLVLRPVSQVLARLHRLGVTHRAIRLNNVFQAASGQPVTLGAGWAAPPAMHQPVLFESPYSAMCHPAGRGEGSIADDVYALGVLLLTLIAGRLPMANLDDATIIRWKLDIGSFAALTRDVGMSGAFGDLLRGMLAEDPDHRPPPGSLMELANSRGRRVATRPARRSQAALMLNEVAVFDARTLAYELIKDEKRAVQFLRNGVVTQWLRRALGDAGLATQIEDLVRGRVADTGSGPLGDALLLMHTVNTLDPLMPLCWRGVMVWPDALASLLAAAIAADNLLLAAIEEVLVTDVASVWTAADPRRAPPDYAEHVQQQHLLQGGGPDGLLRLFYGWNPVLPCRVAAMATSWIISVADLMQFL
ncbi:MAG TPA: hypothetical protein VFG12_10405, partial [Rhodopila sp.]|nr:hypothetical protein [Rhodopila sp.]